MVTKLAITGGGCACEFIYEMLPVPPQFSPAGYAKHLASAGSSAVSTGYVCRDTLLYLLVRMRRVKASIQKPCTPERIACFPGHLTEYEERNRYGESACLM